MQAKRQPAYPLLYSMQGFQYCDLLLAAPEHAAWQRLLECGDLSPLSAGDLSPSKSDARPQLGEPLKRGSALPTSPQSAKSGDESPHSKALRAVSQRAAQIFEWRKLPKWNPAYDPLLDIALDHLTLGRAALYAAILERSAAVSAGPAAATPNTERASGFSNAFFPADGAAGGASPKPALQALQTARRELDAAVDWLRRSGNMDDLPRGLLTRAWLRFLTGACTGAESAQADLDEAWEIAARGPMRLFMADILLTRCRLFGMRNVEGGRRNEEVKYPWESPEADLKATEELVIKCGYHRRDEELADAEQAILHRAQPVNRPK